MALPKALVLPFAALSARVIVGCRQLPTYNGTKSYQNLLVEVYGAKTNTSYNGYLIDSQIQKEPLDFIRSGDYVHSSGNINDRGGNGFYWESQASSTTHTRYLLFNHTTLSPQHTFSKGSGYILRCLVPLEAWQLPTFSGTKSYQNLLVEVYGMRTSNANFRTVHSDSPVQSNPNNFIRSGYYDSDGKLSNRSSYGFYWQSDSESTTTAGILYIGPTLLILQYRLGKNQGFTIRCLVR